MKKHLMLLSVAVVLMGCSSTGNINIVSPSLTESEVREKVSKAPVTKLEVVSGTPGQEEGAAPRRKEAPAAASTDAGGAQEKTETVRPSPAKSGRLDALINLLEKKGIITGKELLEEIEKLK